MKDKRTSAEKNGDRFRSSCPLASALDILGDKWSLLIVRDIYFFDKHRYDEFLASPEKISTNILSDRLKSLEENGILYKQKYGAHARRMSYHLTDAGEGLAKILRSLSEWAFENIPDRQIPDDIVNV